jgi:hypothetical protein
MTPPSAFMAHYPRIPGDLSLWDDGGGET